MEKTLRKTGIFLTALIVLYSCVSSPESSDERYNEYMKKLSFEEKSINTFKNTLVVFSGSMALAFSSVFKEQIPTFEIAFNEELDEKKLREIDSLIAKLGTRLTLQLEQVMEHMDKNFVELSQENLNIYNKIFLYDLMKDGVAITEKYELPAGFRPLSQYLTPAELKRYIIKVSVHSENTKDPVIKTYKELFEWFQKAGDELQKDAEINDFMKGLKN